MSSVGLTNNNIHSQPNEESPYDRVIEITRFLLVYGWIIALLAALGGAGTYLFGNFQDHVYESSADIIILPFGNPSENSEFEAMRALNLNIVGTYVQILQSRKLNDVAIAKLTDLYNDEEISNADVSIRPISNSSVITVAVQSTNPELARDFANAIAQTTIRENPIEPLGQIYPIDLLDTASIPVDTVSPGLLQLTIFGIIGGAAVGLGIAYIMNLMAQYRRTTQVLA